MGEALDRQQLQACDGRPLRVGKAPPRETVKARATEIARLLRLRDVDCSLRANTHATTISPRFSPSIRAEEVPARFPKSRDRTVGFSRYQNSCSFHRLIDYFTFVKELVQMSTRSNDPVQRSGLTSSVPAIPIGRLLLLIGLRSFFSDWRLRHLGS
jgi:hypothetical protein